MFISNIWDVFELCASHIHSYPQKVQFSAIKQMDLSFLLPFTHTQSKCHASWNEWSSQYDLSSTHSVASCLCGLWNRFTYYETAASSVLLQRPEALSLAKTLIQRCTLRPKNKLWIHVLQFHSTKKTQTLYSCLNSVFHHIVLNYISVFNYRIHNHYSMSSRNDKLSFTLWLFIGEVVAQKV